MKLATPKDGACDGRLAVVSRNLTRAVLLFEIEGASAGWWRVVAVFAEEGV